MNKKITCLSKPQIELILNHIDYLIDNKYVERNLDGHVFAEGDDNSTHQMYGDAPIENILHYIKPKVEKAYGKELTPTYSFWRRYYKGQDCPPHKDRPSCEVSVTLNLGGDGGNDWAIYVDDKKFKLKVGQAVIYKGVEQEHWRHELDYNYHTQLFLHYIEKDGQYYPDYSYDGRPNLYYYMD
tara:strand:- start:783 stop:1331 length:549 start_codon:yes stop_codon:yes gene_type:complete